MKLANGSLSFIHSFFDRYLVYILWSYTKNISIILSSNKLIISNTKSQFPS